MDSDCKENKKNTNTKHLIFWPGLIVFNPKMTIFIQINREIKK